MSRCILTLSCDDRIGIVHAVSGFLAEAGCNITDSAQYNDAESGRFFMRISFVAPGGVACDDLAFAPVAERFGMDWRLRDAERPTRTLILVSRFDHCLRDLIYRRDRGELPIDIVGVASNHRDAAPLAEAAGVPFHHLPVTAETKPAQEAALLALVEREDVELVVLARYMQVLSDDLCRRLAGRVINIHHSFLPSFKGARPYHQAHARGVKLIGATAHFATADLDEGPIIEQDVKAVGHADDAEALVALGRDIERVVLARAVRRFAEQRILLNGLRTIIL